MWHRQDVIFQFSGHRSYNVVMTKTILNRSKMSFINNHGFLKKKKNHGFRPEMGLRTWWYLEGERMIICIQQRNTSLKKLTTAATALLKFKHRLPKFECCWSLNHDIVALFECYYIICIEFYAPYLELNFGFSQEWSGWVVCEEPSVPAKEPLCCCLDCGVKILQLV